MKSIHIKDQVIRVDEPMGDHELIWCKETQQEIEIGSKVTQKYLTGQIRSFKVSCVNPCGRKECVYKTVK